MNQFSIRKAYAFREFLEGTEILPAIPFDWIPISDKHLETTKYG